MKKPPKPANSKSAYVKNSKGMPVYGRALFSLGTDFFAKLPGIKHKKRKGKTTAGTPRKSRSGESRRRLKYNDLPLRESGSAAPWALAALS